MTDDQGAIDLGYLPAPPTAAVQETSSVALVDLARTITRPTAPFDWTETLDHANSEIAHRSRDWTGLCQMFCRSMPGCPGGFSSATAQWFGMPAEARHEGESFDAAPVGSMLFSLGDSNPHGHVQIKGREAAAFNVHAISTDSKRVGWPDHVDAVELTDLWKQRRLGWGENMNGLWLQTKSRRPLQNEPYVAIGHAVERLGNALDDLRHARGTAREQNDLADVKIIQAQIDVLRAEKRRLVALFDELRHS